MVGPKFDINDGDFIFGDDNFGVDSDGHTMMGMGGNAFMDLNTGDIHFAFGNQDDNFSNPNFNIWDDDEW